MRPRSEHKGVPRHSWGRCRVGRALQPVFSGRGPWAARQHLLGTGEKYVFPTPPQACPSETLEMGSGHVFWRALQGILTHADARDPRGRSRGGNPDGPLRSKWGRGTRRDEPGGVDIRGDFGNDERTPCVWGVASAVFTPGIGQQGTYCWVTPGSLRRTRL